MKPGDVVLISLPQIAGGPSKLRPALVLAFLPGSFQNLLLSGISTQLRDLEPDWDELVEAADADFSTSGLHRTSAIRLSYLYAADPREISGVVGRIADDRLQRLRERLASHLMP
jgi:mRNA interferase MazF